MTDHADYFLAADIVAIVDSKGELVRSRTGAAGAIWVEAALAAKIIKHAKQLIETGSSTETAAAIYRAAYACGAHPTTHLVVTSKAERIMHRIDEWFRIANASGVLSPFNREYLRYRQHCADRGLRIMTFNKASTPSPADRIDASPDQRQRRARRGFRRDISP